MKLGSVRLQHFRGIGDAAVCFAPNGVTIVEGPNEVGKSCVPEALRLLRAYPDSSRAKPVTDVKPVASDEGPRVEVEMVTGAYRLQYAKQFLVRPSTRLRVFEPRAEQLTGRQAHDRFEEILAETLDRQLWDALQVMQGTSGDQPVLVRIEPLRTALEAGAQTDAGGHDDLLDRVEKEYARYFTRRTGKSTGDLQRAVDALAAADGEVAVLKAGLASTQDRIDELGVVETALGHVRQDEGPVDRELADLRERVEAIAALERDLHEAGTDVVRVRAEDGVALGAVREREALFVESVRRREGVDGHATRLADLTDAAVPLAVEAQVAGDALDAAERAHDEALEAQTAADDALTDLRVQHELHAVDDRVRSALRAHDAVAAATEVAAGCSIDDEVLAWLERLDATRAAAEAACSAASALVEVMPLGDHTVTVDGAVIAGGHAVDVVAPTVVEVPGVLRVVLTPGADAQVVATDAERAAEASRRALQARGVDDVAAARQAASARRTADGDVAHARQAGRDALGRDSLDDLTAHRAALLARLGRPDDDLVVNAAPVATGAAQLCVDEARAAVRAAAASVRVARLVGDEVLARARRHDIARSRADQQLQTAQAERQDAHRVLEVARERVCDDELQTAVEHGQKRLDAALVLQEGHRRRLEQARPTEVRTALDRTLERRRHLSRERATLEERAAHLAGQLHDIEERGLQDMLDTARVALVHARREHGSVRRRADAVALLRQTLLDHRERAHQRYIGPFREAVERLAATVFDTDTRVEVSPELVITAVTRDGETVPFASLSGGAREQLAVLARLACAALVDPTDGAPVLLDDAFGFSDPDRLVRLCTVLEDVGQSGQVIVLTCQPERFVSVGCATHVHLRSS